MMNFVYQKDSSVWCTYFSYVHHRRLSLSFLGGATTVTRPASATISLAAAILAVRLAPAPLQRCLSHQIVGVVILRCPLFAPIGRRRVVPTTISNIVSQSRNPYYQILPRQLDLSIVSSLPRRLPHRQYNATARIVPPVHLLGHLIIKLAFVGLSHAVPLQSSVQSRPSYFGTTRYVDRWRYRSSGMAGRYNCLPVALSDGRRRWRRRRRRPLVMAVLVTAVFTGYSIYCCAAMTGRCRCSVV